MVIGKGSLLSDDLFALLDPGSTHSYVCSSVASRKCMIAEQLEYDIVVTNPLRHSVTVNRVYRQCPIQVESQVFPANLIDLPFHEFDLILGIDWLAVHHAVLDCYSKTVTFKVPGQDEVVLKGEKGYSSCNLISAAKAERFIRKGCEAYLAHVVEVKQVDSFGICCLCLVTECHFEFFHKVIPILGS